MTNEEQIAEALERIAECTEKVEQAETPRAAALARIILDWWVKEHARLRGTLVDLPIPEREQPAPVFIFEGDIGIDREIEGDLFNLVLEGVGTITLRPGKLLALSELSRVAHAEFRREDGARILQRAVLAERGEDKPDNVVPVDFRKRGGVA